MEARNCFVVISLLSHFFAVWYFVHCLAHFSVAKLAQKDLLFCEKKRTMEVMLCCNKGGVSHARKRFGAVSLSRGSSSVPK